MSNHTKKSKSSTEQKPINSGKPFNAKKFLKLLRETRKKLIESDPDFFTSEQWRNS